jgi:hypothetical protein
MYLVQPFGLDPISVFIFACLILHDHDQRRHKASSIFNLFRCIALLFETQTTRGTHVTLIELIR